MRVHGCTTLIVDGVFTATTTAAVVEFQRKRGLKPNGLVDERMWDTLRQLSPLTPERCEIQPLRPGDVGEAVFQLQMVLRSHYSNVIVNGYFDARIAKLVRHFQSKCGLDSTGIVNIETWRSLFSYILSSGDSGKKVRDLQTRLREHGYTLLVNGIFSEETTIAVMDFQQKHGLPVDGLVGLMTWVVLIEATPLPVHFAHLAEICKAYMQPNQVKAQGYLSNHVPASS
ncbi:MAG: hypothetical protein HC769_03720 [Cyanobacteria bacterium CRU_2_1]|nr:hypothetical protein [Cyanobacteria bacterium CRU_2_1]